MAALERHLVAFLADAAAGDLASGHTELAVARLQAALEYNCFAPPIFCAQQPPLVKGDYKNYTSFNDFASDGNFVWPQGGVLEVSRFEGVPHCVPVPLC